MSTESGAVSTPELTTDDVFNFQTEMIQVAAVAVAIVEDLLNGQANAKSWDGGPWRHQVDQVLAMVREERFRQDEKWGPQHHDPENWMLILMEEVGEAAEALRPWMHPTSKSTLRQDKMKEIATLGLKIQRWLDFRGGVPTQ